MAIIINAGEGVEKKELFDTIGGHVNWCSHCGEQYGGSFKKLKIELPLDFRDPTPGIYLKKTIHWKDTGMQIFVAAVFRTARICKQIKCPSTGKGVVLHTHTRTQWNINQAQKRMKYNICTSMDGLPDYRTKWSKPDNERQISCIALYVES